MQNLIPVTAIQFIDNEPRVRDVDLATWLGMLHPLNIRAVIAANRLELEMHGSFHLARENPGPLGGRPGRAYYLNEGQALVLCALSRTAKAAEVRKALIDVFVAYREGKLVHVQEHRRRLPARRNGNVKGYDANLNFLRAFQGNREAMLDIMAGILTRLDELESA